MQRGSFRLTTALQLLAVTACLTGAATHAFAFDLQGHRGARGLAPENTLAGFVRALAVGVTTLETDLAVTRDGVVVISHDPYLNPDLTRDARGAWLAAKGPTIHSLSLAQLQTYELGRVNPASPYAAQFPAQLSVDGQRFPTLAEFFAMTAQAMAPARFNLETKIRPGGGDDTVDAATFARLVIAAVRMAGVAPRTTVQSFDWRTLLEVKRLAPDVATACLTIETPDFDTVARQATAPSPWHAGLDLRKHGGSLPRLVAAAGCSTWSMFWRNVTAGEVAEAHALGLNVLPWTVNDPVEMARLIEMRVDGIITDYPDRLRQVMRAKGMPLPETRP